MASLSRPTLESVLRPAVAIVACVCALALIQRGQDNDSSAATPGVAATFAGPAFVAAAGDAAPVMRVRGLRQGQATSGTVTVRNPGPGSRYLWLSPGAVRERLGSGGGRLSSAVSITVMDVTDVAAPVTIYRGPLRYVGARPLGFLAAGARRTFSFVADLPAGGRSPAAPSLDPYRGAEARIGWSWHSMAGRPDTSTVAAPVRRDRRAPKLTYSVPKRQGLLERRRLTLAVRCDEDCAVRTRATMRSGSRSWRLASKQARRGMSPRHRVTVRLSRTQAAALRQSLVGGRGVRVRVAVRAYDRSGNRGRDDHVIALRPRR